MKKLLAVLLVVVAGSAGAYVFLPKARFFINYQLDNFGYRSKTKIVDLMPEMPDAWLRIVANPFDESVLQKLSKFALDQVGNCKQLEALENQKDKLLEALLGDKFKSIGVAALAASGSQCGHDVTKESIESMHAKASGFKSSVYFILRKKNPDVPLSKSPEEAAKEFDFIGAMEFAGDSTLSLKTASGDDYKSWLKKRLEMVGDKGIVKINEGFDKVKFEKISLSGIPVMHISYEAFSIFVATVNERIWILANSIELLQSSLSRSVFDPPSHTAEEMVLQSATHNLWFDFNVVPLIKTLSADPKLQIGLAFVPGINQLNRVSLSTKIDKMLSVQLGFDFSTAESATSVYDMAQKFLDSQRATLKGKPQAEELANALAYQRADKKILFTWRKDLDALMAPLNESVQKDIKGKQNAVDVLNAMISKKANESLTLLSFDTAGEATIAGKRLVAKFIGFESGLPTVGQVSGVLSEPQAIKTVDLTAADGGSQKLHVLLIEDPTAFNKLLFSDKSSARFAPFVLAKEVSLPLMPHSKPRKQTTRKKTRVKKSERYW